MAAQQTPRPGASKGQDQNAPTTGHSWDGIEEYNNPLPRWWLWTFYLTIVWAIGYWVLYPAWPLINGATPGILGYSTRADVAEEIAAFEARNEPMFVRLVEADLAAVAADEELHSFAVNAGAAVFGAHCSQCHGLGGAGVQASGFPNLVDDDWLWGGDVHTIAQTVTLGIRNPEYLDARYDAENGFRDSAMPAFGDLLSGEEIDALVAHVRRLSNQSHDAALAAAGEEAYLINCASCHGDNGEGDRTQGAPTLNDAIWLYGGSEEAIRHTIVYSRAGVMPGFTDRLREAEIRAVALYVHQLGGGE